MEIAGLKNAVDLPELLIHAKNTDTILALCYSIYIHVFTYMWACATTYYPLAVFDITHMHTKCGHYLGICDCFLYFSFAFQVSLSLLSWLSLLLYIVSFILMKISILWCAITHNVEVMMEIYPCRNPDLTLPQYICVVAGTSLWWCSACSSEMHYATYGMMSVGPPTAVMQSILHTSCCRSAWSRSMALLRL